MKPFVGQIVLSLQNNIEPVNPQTVLFPGVITKVYDAPAAGQPQLVDVIQFSPYQLLTSVPFQTDVATVPNVWYPAQCPPTTAQITTDQMLQLLIHTMNAQSMLLKQLVDSAEAMVTYFTTGEPYPTPAPVATAVTSEDGGKVPVEAKGGVLFDGDKPPVQIDGPVTAKAAVIPEMVTHPATHLTQA